jgi:hypothetical protein
VIAHAQEGPLRLVQILRIAVEIARGMDYLHQRKIIHRDLKAANLVCCLLFCLFHTHIHQPATEACHTSCCGSAAQFEVLGWLQCSHQHVLSPYYCTSGVGTCMASLSWVR